MKMLWCWRCKTEMPMLDEEEYASVSALYSACIRSTKAEREEYGLTLNEVDLDDRFRAVRVRYEELTGMKDCHHDEIMHHRLASYGSPCKRCAKPLRTPQAKICGACMMPVSNSVV